MTDVQDFFSAILKSQGYEFIERTTVKPVLETTCIKRPPALRDHCSDTGILFKSH